MKMKNILFSLAVAALAFAACQKEDSAPVSNDTVKTVNTIVCISDADTKTSLNNKADGSYSVTWSAGDAVAVTTAGASENGPVLTTFALTDGADTPLGVFTSDTEIAAPAEGNYYTAVYPAGLVNTTADKYIEVKFPQTQEYVENGITDGIIPMLGLSKDPSQINFSYGCGVIRLNLTGSSDVKINKIEVTTDVSSTGTLLVKASTSRIPYAYWGKDATKYVTTTYNVPDVALSSTPTQFNICLAATEHPALKVTKTHAEKYATVEIRIHATDGTSMTKTKTDFDVVGGMIHNFPVTEYVGATTYSVGDYYPNEAAPEGVVYSVSDGGAHGMIASMTTGHYNYSTGTTLSNAIDNNDGMKNMNTVKAIDATFESYPAYSWCVNTLGEGWYLPALNELIALQAAWIANSAALSGKFTAKGGEDITTHISGGKALYFTSTEQSSSSKVYWVQIADGATGASTFATPGETGRAHYVYRAVKKF